MSRNNRRGTQTINRIQAAVWRRLPQPVKQYLGAVGEATAKQQQQQEQALSRTSAGRLINRVQRMDATGDTIESISKATNIDARIVSGVAAAAEAAVGGRVTGAAKRLSRASKAATTATRQSRGQGLPNRIQRGKNRAARQQARRERGALGDVHDNFDDAAAGAKRGHPDPQRPGKTRSHSVQVTKDGRFREVPSGRDTSPEAVLRSDRIAADRSDRGQNTPAPRNPPARSDRARQSGRVQRALDQKVARDRPTSEQRANVDAATRGRDVAAEARGPAKQSNPDKFNQLDLPDGGEPKYGTGYRLDPAKGNAGRPSALNSIPKAIKDQVVAEFQQTAKGGAVIGRRGRARTPYVIKAGDKKPSNDYMLSRAREIIDAKNKGNAAQSPYPELKRPARSDDRKLDLPLKGGGTRKVDAGKSGRIKRSVETADQRRQREAENATKADTPKRNAREGRRLASRRQGSNFREGPVSAEDRRVRGRAVADKPAQEKPDERTIGRTPQHHAGRNNRSYNPPRRYANESNERYQQRIKEGRISRSSKDAAERQLEQDRQGLKNRSEFRSSGELAGVRTTGRGTGRVAQRSAQANKQAADLRSGKAKRRTEQQEQELSRIRRRRRNRRGR